MNSLDFLKELNDIDDDLLMKAERPPAKKMSTHRMAVSIVATTLVLCLLSITVAAVSISIRVFTSDDTISNYENYYVGMFPTNSKVTTIEYALHPQKVELPLQWQEELTKAWKGFGYDHEHFVGIDLKDSDGKRINYGGISQLEQLLGIRLVRSKELERITQAAYVTLAITDHARAAAQFRDEGMVSPDGLVIYLPFLRNGQTGLSPEIVDYCGLSIFIPLTEAFAEKYASHCVLSGVYRQDLKQSSLVSGGDVEIVMLENTVQEEEALSGFAAWEQNGIGYLVEMKTNRGVKTLPSDILIEYLKNLEG